MKRTLTFVVTLTVLGFFASTTFAAINLKSVKNAPKVKTVQQVAAVSQPVILVYHSVEPKTDKKESKMQKQYHVFPENFKAQMQYLKDNGYAPIPMKVYLEHINRGVEIPKKSVVLTFDDGWKNQYEYAYPILKEFGYPATFYIITKSVGAKSYVSWDDIKTLKENGMDIQSHTATHPNLSKIDESKARDELISSKKILEEKTGYPVTMVAYPYYGVSKRAQELVAETGYTSARAGWAKYKNSKEVIFALTSQEAVNSKNPFSSKADN